jgi:hypothetical protein
MRKLQLIYKIIIILFFILGYSLCYATETTCIVHPQIPTFQIFGGISMLDTDSMYYAYDKLKKDTKTLDLANKIGLLIGVDYNNLKKIIVHALFSRASVSDSVSHPGTRNSIIGPKGCGAGGVLCAGNAASADTKLSIYQLQLYYPLLNKTAGNNHVAMGVGLQLNALQQTLNARYAGSDYFRRNKRINNRTLNFGTGPSLIIMFLRNIGSLYSCNKAVDLYNQTYLSPLFMYGSYHMKMVQRAVDIDKRFHESRIGFSIGDSLGLLFHISPSASIATGVYINYLPKSLYDIGPDATEDAAKARSAYSTKDQGVVLGGIYLGLAFN